MMELGNSYWKRCHTRARKCHRVSLWSSTDHTRGHLGNSAPCRVISFCHPGSPHVCLFSHCGPPQHMLGRAQETDGSFVSTLSSLQTVSAPPPSSSSSSSPHCNNSFMSYQDPPSVSSSHWRRKRTPQADRGFYFGARVNEVALCLKFRACTTMETYQTDRAVADVKIPLSMIRAL